MSMTVKKGDTVLVITGKDKGKTGKVLEVYPDDSKVLVDGINIVTKHKKAKTQQDKSEIIKKAASMEASNVMVVCGTCGKATRIAHKEISGKNARVCKKCSASLDREFVKATKKAAKKNIAATKTEKAEKAEKTAVPVKATAPKSTAKSTPKTTVKTAAKPASKTRAVTTTQKSAKTSAKSK